MEATAKFMLQNVYKLHGLLSSIVSDQGTQFVSDLWTCWCKTLGVKQKLSTAYHPETYGQSENSNQWLEQYLRTFVNQDQSDWDELLPLAEFAHNSMDSATTQLSPFFINKGFEPTMSFTHEHGLVGANPQQRQEYKQAESIAHHMDDILTEARKNMTEAQTTMALNANKRRQPVNFDIGDLVWLNGKNLRSDRPTKKLDDKMYSPFKITDKK